MHIPYNLKFLNFGKTSFCDWNFNPLPFCKYSRYSQAFKEAIDQYTTSHMLRISTFITCHWICKFMQISHLGPICMQHVASVTTCHFANTAYLWLCDSYDTCICSYMVFAKWVTFKLNNIFMQQSCKVSCWHAEF